MKHIRLKHPVMAAVAACLACIPLTDALAQGSLTPPGAPGPTMKTLGQVEPRTDVSTLAGSADASRVISQPGAYYLTTNLVTVEFKHGIKIEASDVTLDLNGFSVIGGAESRDGITVPAFQTNITIINGIVTGWTNRYGIYCANVYGGTFEHLKLSNNRFAGLHAGRDGIVRLCIARSNREHGIIAGSDTRVTQCSAEYNGGAGIFTMEQGARIEDNHSAHNAFGILSTSGATLIVRNYARNNSGSASNFVFAPGDLVGPVDAPSGILATNNPWINFSR